MTLRWTTTKTFSEQLAELAKLLPKAKKEFDFDSLTGISAGLLFEMGDMDIQVTKEVLAASQNNYNFTARQAAKYLMKTQLAKDFNTLLKPYNLSIASFGTPEQAYFNEKKYLISRSSGKITGSKLETPINKIPEKLFDCDVAMKLKKV
jgi:hypothetical protein